MPLTQPIRALILDMDGVLWRGSQPIGDLPAIFDLIRRSGLKVILATNNSTQTAGQFVQRMQGHGVSLELWQVINSSMAVASMLHKRFPQGGPLYIVGESGLVTALEDCGFYHSAEGAQAVVAGMDRQITYEKLKIATLLIRSGVPFYGSNPDRTYPTPEGLIPGAGTVLAAIAAATDVEPIIAGKPSPYLYQLAFERLELPIEQVLAVGDRLETDILGGFNAGCPTAVVLSGVSTLQQIAAFQPKPDWVADDLHSLVKSLLKSQYYDR